MVFNRDIDPFETIGGVELGEDGPSSMKSAMARFASYRCAPARRTFERCCIRNGNQVSRSAENCAEGHIDVCKDM